MLYNSKCPDCGGNIEKLSTNDEDNSALTNALNKLARWIYTNKKGDIVPEDIVGSVASPLIDKTYNSLKDGFEAGVSYNMPIVMQKKLLENVYYFSGAKTAAQMKEISGLLLNDKKEMRPFSEFWKDVQSINKEYNQNYLEAEYLFAKQAGQMSSKWSEFNEYGDRYLLQYRTAGDSKVRDSHALLNRITLPMDDEFWKKYFPPNGWRCRCTTVQVRKGKYEESDSSWAQEMGDEATAGRSNLFRFNPGIEKTVFPPKHPYFSSLSAAEKEVLSKKSVEKFKIKDKKDLEEVFKTIDKDTDWFEHGFKSLQQTRKRNINGATDLQGNIWLTKDRLDNVISAINKIQDGSNITYEEADAMATLWHEITHNRNKVGSIYKTRLQTRNMELANEFVARNTLPEFYKKLGSEIQFPEFMTNRASTGYNAMVRNYQRIIDATKLKQEDVVSKVKEHLFNGRYDDQKKGLIDALDGAVNKDGKRLTKVQINSLVSRCDSYSTTEQFERYLNYIIH